ncbi:hypothetical protein KEF29_27805 [Streptomyces tuirus]|uniref:Uncharacterized protein n=1 Tax=Streptomyces tuirus TaxID=68278 RepID=A0A941FKY0_9ACTN|nr:hypothetical protein [Streptomyces tuirus]
MHPDIHLALHHARGAELRAQAQTHRRATAPRRELRTRLGWTLVELGLRLATTPRPATAH